MKEIIDNLEIINNELEELRDMRIEYISLCSDIKYLNKAMEQLGVKEQVKELAKQLYEKAWEEEIPF